MTGEAAATVRTDARPPESSKHYAGWRVVAACFVMAVYAWGFCFYGHGFYLAEMKARFGWPASVIAGATTAFYLVSAVLSAFVGDVMQRFGVRRVALAGIVLTGLSASLLPLVHEPWQLYGAYGVMTFGWAATSLTAITTLVGLWFSLRRGLAISIALTGASFGGILIVPMLAFLSVRYGFAASIWAVAGIGGALAFLLAFVCLRGDPPFATGKAGANIASPASTRATLLRSGRFWAVSAPFALGFFAQVGFLVHQIAMLEPVMGRAAAGVAVAATTAAAVCGRLVLGAFVDRVDQRWATGASFLSQAVALGIVWASRDPVMLLGASALFGFSVGNVITLPALIIGREFPARDFAMVVGLSNAVCQIAYSFGPGLLGALRDATGAYSAPLVLCLALDVLAAGAIVLGRRKTLFPART